MSIGIAIGLGLGRSSGVPFSPALDSRLLAWYDGIGAFGYTAPASAVASWPVYAGSVVTPLTQATAGFRPTVSPLSDGVIFDGVDDFLGAAFTFTQPSTVFLVGRILDTLLNGYLMDGAAVNTLAFLQAPNAGDIRQTSNGTAANLSGVNTSAFVLSAVYQSGASNMRLRLNGGVAATATQTPNAPNGLTLGASAVPNHWTHLLINACAVFSGALSAADELKIVAFFQARYGI